MPPCLPNTNTLRQYDGCRADFATLSLFFIFILFYGDSYTIDIAMLMPFYAIRHTLLYVYATLRRCYADYAAFATTMLFHAALVCR